MESPEKELLEAIEELEREEAIEEKPSAVKAGPVEKFIGTGEVISMPILMDSHWGDLLAWTLHSYISTDGWKVAEVLSNQANQQPRYIKANIGPCKHVEVLSNGCLLLSRGDSRLVARIEIKWHGSISLIVSGHIKFTSEVKKFAADIEKTVGEMMLYKGQKLRFDGRLCFLELAAKDWDELAFDSELKEELVANTTGFLKRSDELARYGIPAKRGLILAGAPGTGKTLISKVLMQNSPGITCLTADQEILGADGYIETLYEIACDLSPTIVFLEDIDLVGQERFESHYSRGAPLAALLEALDGVQECLNVVTIATTNCPEILDEALSQRPSRFDRIITMPLPVRDLRWEIVHNLGRRIALDDAVQSYIVQRTEGYTPTQIQEVVYSLVIHQKDIPMMQKGQHRFTIEEVDNVLRWVRRKNGEPMGFKVPGNHRSSMDIDHAIYFRNSK